MSMHDPVQSLARDLVAGRLSRRAFIARAAALGLSASAIAAVLAACGAAATVTAPPAPTASAAASPAAGSAGGLGGASALPKGGGGGVGPGPTKRGGSGTLKMLWWQAPTILNPHQAQGTKDFDASRVAYEPLASFGPD